MLLALLNTPVVDGGDEGWKDLACPPFVCFGRLEKLCGSGRRVDVHGSEVSDIMIALAVLTARYHDGSCHCQPQKSPCLLSGKETGLTNTM